MYILAHDIGTTSNKTCLYRLEDRMELVETAVEEYLLYTLPNGGVEQNADEWWQAISRATRAVMQQSGIAPTEIKGMAFCAQMQGFVAVDKDGQVLRNPMSYLDNRGTAQIEKGLYHGFPRIEGWNAHKTLRSLQITGGLSASVKDPVWKYLWMRDNEPELFAHLHKWLDVNDYLVWCAVNAPRHHRPAILGRGRAVRSGLELVAGAHQPQGEEPKRYVE